MALHARPTADERNAQTGMTSFVVRWVWDSIRDS